MTSLDLRSLLTKKGEKAVIFLSGIGGIGISAIADILNAYGLAVMGSDLKESANTSRLAKAGIKIIIGQKAENITSSNIDLFIRSSAISDSNPEVVAAKANNIPILSRTDILSAILELKKSVIVSGSHGKTTTTSLIGHIACSSKLDPTILSGGIMNNYNSNAVTGGGDWIIAEADESDGCFNKLSSVISVLTNIEAEHMDYFKSIEYLKESFLEYINKVPDLGYNVICYDDKICRELIHKSDKKNIITYGLNKNADIYAENIKVEGKTTSFTICSNISKVQFNDNQVTVNLVGNFNVLNTLAAIIVSKLLKIDEIAIKQSLKSFFGIKRRMTLVGEVNNISIYDDYAHHPTEIEVTLKTIKKLSKNKTLAVFQPHRYSRMRDHYDRFIKSLLNADKVIVTDIFAAGENPISGIDKESICRDLNIKSENKCSVISNFNELAEKVKLNTNPGDIVVCLGAGDITNYANLLPSELSKI